MKHKTHATGAALLKFIVFAMVIFMLIMTAVPYYLTREITSSIDSRSEYSGTADYCVGTECRSATEELKKNEDPAKRSSWAKKITMINMLPAVVSSYTGSNQLFSSCQITISFQQSSWVCAVNNCGNSSSNGDDSPVKLINKFTNNYCD